MSTYTDWTPIQHVEGPPDDYDDVVVLGELDISRPLEVVGDGEAIVSEDKQKGLRAMLAYQGEFKGIVVLELFNAEMEPKWAISILEIPGTRPLPVEIINEHTAHGDTRREAGIKQLWEALDKIAELRGINHLLGARAVAMLALERFDRESKSQ